MRLLRLVRVLLALSTLAGALAVAIGFFGAFAPPFDSFAHFRFQLGLVLSVIGLVALVCRAWVTLAGALGAGALALATSLPWLLPQASQPPPSGQPAYSLLQMNLQYHAADKTGALRRIAEARPDIVTLQEVTGEWKTLFSAIEASYPHQTYCGIERRDGIAILSRRPFVGEPLCERQDGRVTQRIDLNGRILDVTSLHLDWPWPRRHWEQIERLRASLSPDGTPSLLGGDFNAATWSAAVRTVAEAGGWRIVRGVGPTWLTLNLTEVWPRWLGLPIDHLLASPAVVVSNVTTLERTSSDHLPVLLDFWLLPSPETRENAVAGNAAGSEASASAVARIR